MRPNFTYPDPSVDVSKLAYDLALIYAHAKFDEILRSDPEYFLSKPASPEVEEMVFLEKKFVQAYGYYMGSQLGDFERSMKDYAY